MESTSTTSENKTKTKAKVTTKAATGTQADRAPDVTAMAPMTKVMLAALALLLLGLQFKLWFGEGGMVEAAKLKLGIAAQRQENLKLKERNDVLRQEVRGLKVGLEAIEELSRIELGMIKKDETFYFVDEGSPR